MLLAKRKPKAWAVGPGYSVRDARFIGPRLPLTLTTVAARARNDSWPLRGPKGGRLTAEGYPEVLLRQVEEFEEMFGSGGAGGLPRWLVYAGLAALALVLAGVGYVAAPMAMGVSSGAVAGAGSTTDTAAPYAGAVVGLLLGAGVAVWAVLASRRTDASTGGDSDFEKVYARARITQVEYRDDAGQPVGPEEPAARRHVVRRMLTYLRREAFADRQQGVFVGAPGMSRDKRFRNGDIRLETTKDLSRLVGPQDLYDAQPLSGRWRGMGSIRWYVALRDPIETGMYAREYDQDSDTNGAFRRALTKNYGLWVLLGCIVAGLLLFFATLEAGSEAEEGLPDRTPAAADVTVNPNRE